MNCSFSCLFQPLANLYEMGVYGLKLFQFLKSIRRVLRLFGIVIFNHSEKKDLISFLEKGDFRKYWLTIVLSYSRFHDGDTPDFNDVFKLQPSLMEELNRLTADFSHDVVGIHIRRTDHGVATQCSPLEVFIQKIEQELSRNPNARFYLASDDVEVVRDIQRRFGDCIVNFPGPLDRASVAGIQHAVLELYVLSRCRCIWGSFGSTYSDFASIIGKIPLETVTSN